MKIKLKLSVYRAELKGRTMKGVFRNMNLVIVLKENRDNTGLEFKNVLKFTVSNFLLVLFRNSGRLANSFL